MLVPTIRAASNVKSCFGQEQQQHFITKFYKKDVKIQFSPKNGPLFSEPIPRAVVIAAY